MATLLDCFNLLSDICDRLTTTKIPPSKPDKSIDDATKVKPIEINEKKLCIAIENGETICSIYSQIKTTNALEDTPKYKYWADFCPDVAIAILNTVEIMFDAAVKIGYNAARMRELINGLTEVVKPFRIYKPVQTAVKTLGLKSYQFNPYAIWVNSFSDHKLPYKVWLAQL